MGALVKRWALVFLVGFALLVELRPEPPPGCFDLGLFRVGCSSPAPTCDSRSGEAIVDLGQTRARAPGPPCTALVSRQLARRIGTARAEWCDEVVVQVVDAPFGPALAFDLAAGGSARFGGWELDAPDVRSSCSSTAAPAAAEVTR